MSGDLLLIEEGAVETRATLIRDGGVVRFWFGPALGAEHLDFRPLAGRHFAGRIRRVDAALSAAFVDIGDAEDAFLPFSKTKGENLVEGASVCLRIAAVPRRGKGAVAELLSVSADAATLGRIDTAPAAVEAFKAIGADGARIVTDSAAAVQSLSAHGVEAVIAKGEEARAQGLFAAYDVDAALDGALGETVMLAGGGALHFFQSEALAAIDVDTGAAEGASPDRLREKAIVKAVREIVLQIEQRNLSGRVVIDFPSIRSREIRARAVKQIETALSQLSRLTSKSIAGSNLVTLTRERRGVSLWDEATEPAPAEPVAGRRFTLSWLARAAIRAAERRHKSAPTLRLEVRCGSALDAYMRKSDDYADAYLRRWGASLIFTCDEKLGDRDFELVER